jgi:uncharacterized protein YjiS (DUF1127 family)
MTASTATVSSTGARSRSGRAFEIVRSLALALAEEIRLRRSLRQLSAFDDAMLHDIGVDRGSLEDAVRFGRPTTEGTLVYRTCDGRSSLTPGALTEWR